MLVCWPHLLGVCINSDLNVGFVFRVLGRAAGDGDVIGVGKVVGVDVGVGVVRMR